MAIDLPFGGAAMRTGPVGRMVAVVPMVPGAAATPMVPGAPATPMALRATPPGTTACAVPARPPAEKEGQGENVFRKQGVQRFVNS